MAEAARVAVAVVVGEVRIVLGAVVVGQLQHALLARQPLAAALRVARQRRGIVHVGQEVQAEPGIRELAHVNQGVAEHAGVEVQRTGDVLHPQHRVVEHESGGLGGARVHAREGVEFLLQAHCVSLDVGEPQ